MRCIIAKKFWLPQTANPAKNCQFPAFSPFGLARLPRSMHQYSVITERAELRSWNFGKK